MGPFLGTQMLGSLMHLRLVYMDIMHLFRECVVHDAPISTTSATL